MVLNDDFSAQDKPRELKLVSLELPGNEDFEDVFKVYLTCLCTKRQLKTSDQFLTSLCDENRCLLGRHVVDKSEKCGHMWNTARGESVNLGIRVNIFFIYNHFVANVKLLA